MNEIYKINDSAKMSRSAENSATAHTLVRCGAFNERNKTHIKVVYL